MAITELRYSLRRENSSVSIAIHGGYTSVYVNCRGDHTDSKFSLTAMWGVRRIAGEGSNNGQFALLFKGIMIFDNEF